MPSNAAESVPDIARPYESSELYDSRRRAIGAKHFEMQSIPRENTEKRGLWRLYAIGCILDDLIGSMSRIASNKTVTEALLVAS